MTTAPDEGAIDSPLSVSELGFSLHAATRVGSHDARARQAAAWADPVQKRRWFAEGENWTVLSFEVDFRQGGFERSRFRFKDGPEMGNDTHHHVIIPNRRIVSSYSMTLFGKPFSVSLATVELEPAGAGTRLRYTEQAAFFEGADGVERRRKGCEFLLDKLGEEVSPTPSS